jgi:hypothetical protein
VVEIEVKGQVGMRLDYMKHNQQDAIISDEICEKTKMF